MVLLFTRILICTYIYKNTCEYIYILYIGICLHIHVFMYVYTYVFTCTYIHHMYGYLQIYVYICMLHTHICACVCLCADIRVNIYKCKWIFYTLTLCSSMKIRTVHPQSIFFSNIWKCVCDTWYICIFITEGVQVSGRERIRVHRAHFCRRAVQWGAVRFDRISGWWQQCG